VTSVTFETAALQSSLAKAESIAPDKGNAFDKAAGIVLEISPADEAVVLRSTNLDIYYLEWLDAIESSGEHVVWRLPSRVLTAFIKSLPIGSGKTVTLTQDGNAINFVSDRTKAKLQMMDASSYIIWEPYDEEGMTEVKGFGSRIAQVEWAASKDVVELGLRIEPGFICATDRYRLAVAPMDIAGMTQGITIPPATLSAVIRAGVDAKLRVEGSQLLVMPDEHTQLRCIIIGEDYPSVTQLMNRERAQFVKFKKTEMLEMVRRALSISSDRAPRLRLIIGKGEVAAMVSETQTGHVGDVMLVGGQCDHGRCEISVTPSLYIDALTNSPSEEIEFGYDPANTKRGFLYFNGGSGYEVWMAPLGDVPTSTGEER
jgi:DNA polymerase III sliding clamp (beta) subunit (PCNA family)